MSIEYETNEDGTITLRWWYGGKIISEETATRERWLEVLPDPILEEK